MRHLLFYIFTVFMSCSLVYGNGQGMLSPGTQKKIDAVKQAEKRMNQPTPDTSENQPQASDQETPKEASPNIEEQLLEKAAPPKQTTTQKKPCAPLPIEEQAFANNLGPLHKQVFCSKFTSDMRKMAMNMAGKRDSKGVIITPLRAVSFVATENDIDIPIIEKKTPPSLPQLEKEIP